MIASIIVNFNSVEHLRVLLGSGGLSGTDVFVVDNGSEPEEVLELCDLHRATPILLPMNVGFAAGVNTAVEQLPQRYEAVLLVNPDVILDTGSVAHLAESIEVLGADAVCPVITIAGTDHLRVGNGGGPLTVRSMATYFWFLAHVCPRFVGIFMTRAQVRRLRDPRQLHWLCMACMLITREALTRYGPIPEDEIVYSEDVAWGTAATAAGARLFVIPSARVGHIRGASGGSSYAASADSLSRLLRRRIPPAQATVARFVLWSGLSIRRALGREIE